MTEPDENIPYLLVEVTVAGAFVDADGMVIGDNVADATLQFGWRADNLPAVTGDEYIQEALRLQLGPLLALVRMTMTSNRWAYFGETDAPMAQASHPTGRAARTELRLLVPMPDLPEGRA
jgi:hypothetical protein